MSKQPKKNDVQPVQWVSVDLTPKQKDDMKSRFPDWDAVNEAMLKEIEGGYKITLSYDNRNKCFSAYLIPVELTSPNAGCILSARGSSPFAAMRGVAYRHFVVFGEDWGNRQSASVDDD